MFTYVDLFAGCGGLSLGLRKAGGNEVLAVEKADGAAHTYFTNLISTGAEADTYLSHKSKSLIDQAKRGLAIAPIADVLKEYSKLEIPEDLDLVAGGPPCQGFSLAGKRDRDDERNKLVWQFLKFVSLSKPKIVIIENVVGMGRKFDKADEQSTFADVQAALSKTGPRYVVNGVLVNAVHYGAPQYRPRLMVIGVRKDIAEALGLTAGGRLWQSHFSDEGSKDPVYAPAPTVRKKGQRTLEDAIGDLAGRDATNADRLYRKLMHTAALWGLRNGTGQLQNNELRKHRDTTKYRFQFAQSLARMGISSRVLGPLAEDHREKELKRIDRWFDGPDSPSIRVGSDLFTTTEEYRAKLATLVNKKHSQRVLQWGSPARTVVTIPDDFIHPDVPRTFSVRELARIQGFPDAFVFEGKATTGGDDRKVSVPQYTQVGNAVSPMVGVALGTLVEHLLALHLQASASQGA